MCKNPGPENGGRELCPSGGRAGPAAATGSSWQTAGSSRAVMDVLDEFGVTQLMPCPDTAYVGSRCPRSETPAVKRLRMRVGGAGGCVYDPAVRNCGGGGGGLGREVIYTGDRPVGGRDCLERPVGGHAGLQSRTGHFGPGGRIPAGAALIGSGQARRGTHTHTPARDAASAGAQRGQDLVFGQGMFVPRCPGCRFCGSGNNSWAKCDCRIFRPIGKTRGRSRPGVCAVRGLAGTGAALPMPEGSGVNTGLFVPKREPSDAAVGSEPKDVPDRRVLGDEFPGILCLPACTFSGSEHRYGQTSCPIQTCT